jgi:N-acetylglutamate synthase-like GNAT family acetyltransferase
MSETPKFMSREEFEKVIVKKAQEDADFKKALLEKPHEAIPQVFVLTYQQKFFEKCGFKVISKESLPQKVWKECVNCPKFPNCEEIAMIYSPMTTTG